MLADRVEMGGGPDLVYWGGPRKLSKLSAFRDQSPSRRKIWDMDKQNTRCRCQDQEQGGWDATDGRGRTDNGWIRISRCRAGST